MRKFCLHKAVPNRFKLNMEFLHIVAYLHPKSERAGLHWATYVIIVSIAVFAGS